MDDVSIKNILALEAVGERMVEEYDEHLKSFVRQLCLNHDLKVSK